MTDSKWDFKKQLTVGDRGEELFMEHYHSPLIVYPEHKADFKRVSDGKLVELKTDTYNMEKTPNFFWERWGDVHKEKPGGPWRALADRVPIFVYMFVRHNVYYEFSDLKALCKLLDQLTEKKGMIYIKNRNWITGGYAIPRELVKHLYKEHRFEPKDKGIRNK
jgi:hypothetical protein